jgi:rod shape-determining protein MreC
MLIFTRYSWWVGAMVALAVFLVLAGQVGVLTPFQSIFLKATSPLEAGMRGVFKPVASFLSNIDDLDTLRDENRRLRLQNEELQVRVTELEQDSARVQELEQALGITRETAAGDLQPANVVHRDSSPFTALAVVDRGSSSGIRNGMVVLSSQGSLVGTVVHTTGDRAFVRLISDSKSRVNAEVLDTHVEGVVSGSPGQALTFGLAQAEVKAGDKIISSGLGGNYPRGLLIGTVSEVTGSPQDLYRRVKIDPAVRLSTIETVLILTSFIPQRVDLESR